MAEINDMGLLLRRIPFSETSLILHLLTENHGRIALMAKGARRAKSPFRASLMEYCSLQLTWRSGRTGMGTLTEVTRVTSLLHENKWLAGMEIQTIAAQLFHEGDPHGFLQLQQALMLLQQRDARMGMLMGIWHLLQNNGWIGDMNHCWRCANLLQDRAVMLWHEGELCCRQCAISGFVIHAGIRKSITLAAGHPLLRMHDEDLQLWQQCIMNLLRIHGIRWQPNDYL
ncbi:MAG: DNA repair protein RecO [Zetaproteobacteria bacterium]|nr:DNA repair protein RecO [Zetaproteobacteria bacterium]